MDRLLADTVLRQRMAELGAAAPGQRLMTTFSAFVSAARPKVS